MAEEKSETNLKVLILKYFAHGILFSLLSIGLLFVVKHLVTLALLDINGILLIMAILYILPMPVGVANSLVTRFLWFPVEYSWFGTWAHGGLLLVALIAVGFTISLALSGIPPETSTIISFVTGAFIDGFIGKGIAGIWEEVREEKEEET